MSAKHDFSSPFDLEMIQKEAKPLWEKLLLTPEMVQNLEQKDFTFEDFCDEIRLEMIPC